MAVAYEDKEIELNGVVYLCEVEIYAKMIDESFSHEFGIESAWSTEVVSVEIITVYDNDDNVVTSRSIISQLENRIDIDDFNDVEFDFSE